MADARKSTMQRKLESKEFLGKFAGWNIHALKVPCLVDEKQGNFGLVTFT